MGEAGAEMGFVWDSSGGKVDAERDGCDIWAVTDAWSELPSSDEKLMAEAGERKGVVGGD